MTLAASVCLFVFQDPVITKGLSCLRSVIEEVKNTYTTALLAYTFSLARDTNTRQQLFNKLEDLAISDGKRLLSDDFLHCTVAFVLLVEFVFCVLKVLLSTGLSLHLLMTLLLWMWRSAHMCC